MGSKFSIPKSFYSSWANMKSRCKNPKVSGYKNYGGRGITYQDSWEDFSSFYEDMFSTYRTGLTLDRENNNGNYTKDNCRWATREQQNNNTRRNVHLTIDGVTKTLAQWACYFEIDKKIVYKRRNDLSWPDKQLFSPMKRKMRMF